MEAAAASGLKRKVCSGESEVSASSFQLKNRRFSDVAAANFASNLPATSSCETVGGEGDALASCCSSNGSSEVTKEASGFVDLKDDDEATVEFLSASARDLFDCGEIRREGTPLRVAQAELGELESTARPRERDPHRRSAPVKMPSEAELEEFFVAAEKSLQQKFIDKYNFDIVKDQPLEGRYEWVQVQVASNEEKII